MAGYATPSWANGTSPAVSAANLTAMGQAVELAQHPYGVCSTAAGTKAKTVTIDFSGTLSLFDGLCVRVKFSNNNTATNPTLNVNGTGAKNIVSIGTTNATTWVAGQILEFTYDATNTVWAITGVDGFTKTQTLSGATAAAIASVTGGSAPATPDAAFLALSSLGGNAKIKSGSYTGTGTYGSGNKNTLLLGFSPVLVAVYGTNYGIRYYNWWIDSFVWLPNVTTVEEAALNGSIGTIIFSSTATSLSWYSINGATTQLNASGQTYYYVALGA